MSRSSTWVFTLNNYEESDIDRLTHLNTDLYWCVFGEEVGEQGTPHLQGFISCEKRLMRSNVERILGGRAWIAVTHDVEAAIGYSVKDGLIHCNHPIPEHMGEMCKLTCDVCKEMGMKKYLYHSIGSTFANDHVPPRDREIIRVEVGFHAYLEGIHWWDQSTWKK